MASKRKKARVTHTKRRKKATPIRRKTMARKKSGFDSEDTSEDTYMEDETEQAEGEEGEPSLEQIAKEQTGGSTVGPLETTQIAQGARVESQAQKARGESDEPVKTETQSTEEGVYVIGQGPVAIGTEVYNKGDHVNLSPEELESVQAAGVQILPVD
jgi:hypothetical protein